jgi:hypothetical protein
VDPTEKSKRIDPQIKEKTAQLEYRNMKETAKLDHGDETN